MSARNTAAAHAVAGKKHRDDQTIRRMLGQIDHDPKRVPPFG